MTVKIVTEYSAGVFEIREVRGEEILATAYPIQWYAFLPSPRAVDEDWARQRLATVADARVLVGFEDGAAVAAATALPLVQNVRGRLLPMSGLASVSSLPGARRRGYQRQLLTRLLTEAAADFPVTCLYPFRDSFYGSFGYVGLQQLRIASFAPSTLAPLLRADLDGSVEMLSAADGAEPYLELLRAVRAERHGFALHEGAATARLRAQKTWVALARDGAGAVVAGMTYTITDLDGKLVANSLVWRTVAGRSLLLQWFARHIDQVRTVEVKIGPDASPELWAYDLAVDVRSYLDNGAPMARVLSVRGLAGLEVGDAEVTVRLRDPLCPGNDGVFTLRGGPGGLDVKPGGEAACALSIEGLSALVYLGTEPEELAGRGWSDATGDAAEALRTLFPPARPFLYEEF